MLAHQLGFPLPIEVRPDWNWERLWKEGGRLADRATILRESVVVENQSSLRIAKAQAAGNGCEETNDDLLTLGTAGQPGNSRTYVLPMYCRSLMPISLE